MSKSVRIPDRSYEQADELRQQGYESLTNVMAVAIDRLYQAERPKERVMEKMVEAKVTEIEVSDPDATELFRNEARCPFCGYLNYRLENDYQIADKDICKHFDGGVIGRLHFYQE